MAAADRLTPVQGELVGVAAAAAEAAYAPYSGFRVGAAALASSGRIFSGCNVENVSYPVTLCAEQSAVGAAVAAGERQIVAVAVAAGDVTVETVTPCGMCRQFLAEFGSGLIVVFRQGGEWVAQPLADLLPAAFALGEQGAAAQGAGGRRVHGASGGETSGATASGDANGVPRLRLRRVVRADIAELEGLARREQEVFGHTGLRLEDLSVFSRAGAVLVGSLDGSFVGSCQLLRTYDEPETAWIVGFYVLPSFRGTGLGGELLAAVAAEAADAGIRRLRLTVAADNAPALNLYQSFGFDMVETIPDFYGPGEDRLLLLCSLRSSDRRAAEGSGRPSPRDADDE